MAQQLVMAVQAADFVKLVRDRLIELMPFGLYRIWFCVKGGSIRLLAMVLGYAEETMLDILRIPPFSRQNSDYLVDNWSTILELPVERRTHGREIYVRFGPLQGSRRENLSMEEVRMRHEAASTTPNDAHQDRYFVEFLEAASMTRSIVRDVRPCTVVSESTHTGRLTKRECRKRSRHLLQIKCYI